MAVMWCIQIRHSGKQAHCDDINTLIMPGLVGGLCTGIGSILKPKMKISAL